MEPSLRPVRRDAFLAIVVLLSLALASCAPIPAGPASTATTQQPQQAPTSAALSPTSLPATVSPTANTMPAAPTSIPSAGAAAGTSTGQTSYEDPSGRFAVPVPASWKAESGEGFVVLRDPEDALRVYVVVVPGEDTAQAIADAWAVVDPTFTLAPTDIGEAPSKPGIDQTLEAAYDAGDQRAVMAIGRRVGDLTYALLFDGSTAAFERRYSQLDIIQGGLAIAGIAQVDLTNVRARTLTPELLDELESYITQAMEQAKVPGTAVAIVQDGQVVFLNGFGVREKGKTDPVTPDTLMMIGSVTKSMTTMMMATLVDDQRMDWNTRAVEILPSFAVADPELTQRITMRNLVCACTGVPRRDAEFLFNGHSLTADDVIASLASFQFYTKFGEAWQYSNQMVAAGGYLAGLAGSGRRDDLYGGYLEQMQQRVFDPIGMPHTSFDFGEVAASPDYATPHGQNVLFEYSPIPLDVERVVTSVAPAGGAWSNVRDMARYLITEFNEGVNPDGARMVSAENLRVTWEPQVQVNATARYGLGWIVDTYKGLELVHHGGNSAGFTADLAFLPKADLGIVVLTNARASTAFNQAVRFRLFELAFELPAEQDAQFRAQLESNAKTAQDVRAQLKPSVDSEQVAAFLGSFTNPVLGDITLSLAGEKLMLDAGEFVIELRPLVDEAGPGLYIANGQPLTGRIFELRQGEGAAATPGVVLHFLPDNYIFTRK